MATSDGSASTTRMALQRRSVPGGSRNIAEAAICASHTPVGAGMSSGRPKMPGTSSWKCHSRGPRGLRSWKSSCGLLFSWTNRSRMSRPSTESKTMSSPICTRSTAITCAAKTRRSRQCASCSTARTTEFLKRSSRTACSRRQTSRPPTIAQSLAARACAPHCVTTTADIARRGTSGTGATCSAWASTSQISPRSRTAIARSQSSSRTAAVASAWCCARSSAGRWSCRGI
mmetsp:Transcript_133060/g.332117  ORF Transcript_133060/g.332117 Transcript_133060/m.332117 type:complete len:230 (-) Transcript_133060:415-1104(-)